MNKIDKDFLIESFNMHDKETFSGNFKHITYKEKINKSYEELIGTDPRDIIKWGWTAWDMLLGGIYGGKIYAIGADSGSGKSTFINQITMSLSKQGIKVTKYSLEDRLEDIGKEELFYYSNRFLKKEGKSCFEWNNFNNGEYTHKNGKFYNVDNLQIIQKAKQYLEKLQIKELEKQKQVTIGDLVKLMEEEVKEGTKVFFIDHLHYFKMNSQERTDLEIQNIMHDINEVARKNNVAIFIVAHYKKLNGQEPNNDSFKDASAIKQVANIIINIVRKFDTSCTEFRIDKIRGPIKLKTIEGKFDIETYTYKDFIYLEN